jgi:hypothetical protein
MRGSELALLLMLLAFAALLSRKESAVSVQMANRIPPPSTVESPITQSDSDDILPDASIASFVDSVTASRNPWMEMSGPTTRTPQFRPHPDTRDNMIGYFVQKGLASADAERIVDTALSGLSDCVRRAFGFGLRGMRTFLESCNQDVLQEAGMPTAIHIGFN